MNIIARVGTILRNALSRVHLSSERGATAVEYGMIASLIAAVVIVSVFYLGQVTNDKFECTKDSMVANTNMC